MNEINTLTNNAAAANPFGRFARCASKKSCFFCGVDCPPDLLTKDYLSPAFNAGRTVAAPHLPLVNLRYGIHPYIDAVRDSYLERLNQKYIEKSVPPRVSKRQKMQRFDIANNFFGTERHLSGLRIDEKGIRQLSIKAQGLITKNSCRPLGYWSTEDVFAYLTLHNLPVHPNYAMLGGGRFDRNYIRVGSIGGHRGTNLGRREWEQEYYPEFALR